MSEVPTVKGEIHRRRAQIDRKREELDDQQPEQSSGGEAQIPREFLLHCWRQHRAASNGRSGWRFSLVEVEGEHRQYAFETLEELVTFLRRELGVDNREQR